MANLDPISQDDLGHVLDRHRLWLATDGAEGEQADLRGRPLTGRSLWRADLRRARMEDCDLARADMDHADLREATLQGARLTGASLWEAKLAKADLRDADLRDTKLDHADLRGALLDGARLQGASLQAALTDGPPPNTSPAPARDWPEAAEQATALLEAFAATDEGRRRKAAIDAVLADFRRLSGE